MAFFAILAVFVGNATLSLAEDDSPPASAWPLALTDGWRTEVGLPFYYEQQQESEHTWAIPPFYSHCADPAIPSHEDDYLYPALSRIQYGQESRWQLAQLFSFEGAHEQSGVEKKRFTIFPFYFSQRSPDTNFNYTAVAPFYGHLKDRLFRDEIFFVMFPGYGQTRKRDVVTDHYCYPIVSTVHGDGLKGWSVFPIVGQEHKTITTNIDGFGDAALVPGYNKSFYIWPLILRQDSGIGTENPEKFRAVIPFYVSSRSPGRDYTSVIWPLFAWVDNRALKYHEWEGPWPFVIFARGPGKTTSRVWPLFSQSSNGTQTSDSYLWPLYIHRGLHSAPLDRQRTQIAFYLYSRTIEKNTQTGSEMRRVAMWPFFTSQKDFNGNQRLQVLALVEPALPENRGVERNWSPLWTFWHAETNAKTRVTSRTLLWNLYHRETGPDYKKSSLLFGFYQYESSGINERTRWFYRSISAAPWH